MIHAPSPSTTGVPTTEATARDFIQVRAALVRRFGSADDALVWTRIYWRTDSRHRDTYAADGHEWWAPDRDQLADETGLKQSQVRRALERLEAGNYILGVQHRRGGPYDRQKSYTCVLTEMADLPQGNADSAPSEMAEMPDVQGADLPDVPSIETSMRQETQALVVLDEPSFSIDAEFDRMWEAWPRTEKKADAKKALVSFLNKRPQASRGVTASQIADAACTWAYGAARRVEAQQFQPIPYLASWLRSERWTEPAPKLDATAPAGHDRDLADIEAARDIGRMLDQQTRQGIGR